MEYRTLSQQIKQLDNPQRSDQFVKMFRSAVADGDFQAVNLTDRFELPKIYSRRGQEGTYQKETRDMVFDVTPEFEAWFERVNVELGRNRRQLKVRPSLAAYASGQLDFELDADRTRAKMQASRAKGQKLGSSRAQSTRRHKK
ncbi:MAG: hypothetical protein U0Z75_10060 [Deinococcaceae bacterium]